MEIIAQIANQFFGVTGLIKSFFGGLADLNTAPVYAASGSEGIVAAVLSVITSISKLINGAGEKAAE